jgi:hypothetical protein
MATAVADRLRLIPGLAVDIDTSGLDAGKPWRRKLHELMARCGAGLVLLTPAVLKRPKWVLKEAIILGWRLDLEPKFTLFFVLAPGVTRADFEKCGFDMAQLSETQLVTGELIDITKLDSLIAKLQPSLPVAQPVTPFDELIGAVTQLLRVADQTGATYHDIATYLGITDVLAWGPLQLELLADRIAREIVEGRDENLPISGLIVKLGAWLEGHRKRLLNLLSPWWIDMQLAGALLRRAPQNPGTLTIAGSLVPDFTAMMTVRRAFNLKEDNYRQAEAVGLNGGDLFEEIRLELCEYARSQAWVPRNLKNDKLVVAKLRDSPSPIFVPLGVLPDSATAALLRTEFPRVIFIAPRPPERIDLLNDDLLPDPDLAREKAAYEDWMKATGAVANG